MSGRQPAPVEDAETLDEVLRQPLAVLYKHSPYCGLSARALREVLTFMSAHPRVPVYQVDVVGTRPLSREVAERLSVRHESPQVLVLREGDVAWHGSHRSVTSAALERETR